MGNSTKYKEEEEILVEEILDNQLVLFNDDHNTFDHVIDSLVSICKHEPLQAEQCALIVHYKGKCTVKTGLFSELEPMASALLNKDLTVEIQ